MTVKVSEKVHSLMKSACHQPSALHIQDLLTLIGWLKKIMELVFTHHLLSFTLHYGVRKRKLNKVLFQALSNDKIISLIYLFFFSTDPVWPGLTTASVPSLYPSTILIYQGRTTVQNCLIIFICQETSFYASK